MNIYRIIHFITDLSTGGAQVSLFRLLKQLDRERFSQSVVCLYNGDGLIAEQIRSLGIPVIDLNMSNKLRLDAFWRFYRLLQEQQPLILHTWMFHANIPGRVLGRIAGIPVIISSERTMRQEGKFRQLSNRYTASLSDRIVCVSVNVAKYTEQTIHLPPEKLVVIPNGVDRNDYRNLPSKAEARRLFQLPDSALIIGAIGRMHRVKGLNILLSAFAQLAELRGSVHLLFVGEGSVRQLLIDQTHDFGLNSKVTFLAFQKDIPKLLPALDLFVSASLHEGMPNAVLEAMAAGLPVVATDVGGTPEVVQDGQTGFLVPPGEFEALAISIDKLLEDPDLRCRMGKEGKERVARYFSIEQMSQQYEQLYEQLLVEKGGQK